MKNYGQMPFSSDDEELVNAAVSLIRRRGEYGRHHIACALRTNEGEIITGLHISANIGCRSTCAETSAIAEMLKKGSLEFNRIVSVRRQFDADDSIEVVPPCGQCRELILEYGPESLVVVEMSSQRSVVPIKSLLPFPFKRRRPQFVSEDSGEIKE